MTSSPPSIAPQAFLIHLDNSYARVAASAEVMALLRYDLAYLSDEPYVPGVDGDHYGWRWLIDRAGVMPSGLAPKALRLLAKYQVPTHVVDPRKRPADELPLHARIPLRDYQQRLVDRALELGRGVIDASPRSGKTRCGAAIIDAQPHKTLWLAPTKAIVRQTARVLRGLLPLGPDGILEQVGGWPKLPSGAVEGSQRLSTRAEEARDRISKLHAAHVVVTTAATAVKMPQAFYDTRDRIIVDEWHHAGAPSYSEINSLARNIYFRIGMTGTHFRSDENTEILMDAILSDVIGSVSVQELVDKGHLAPVDVVFVPIEQPLLGPCALDTAYRIGITKHQRRNQWAAYAAKQLLAFGRSVIVLVKHISHGEELAELIPEARFVRGADGHEVTDEDIHDALAAFNNRECKCLIGTSVLGEGIDLPAADALVYAKGGSASVTVTQDVFRVLTAHPEKDRAIVVDFADRHHESLLAQSLGRARIYAGEQAFTSEVLRDPMELPSWLARRTKQNAL